MSPAPTTSSFSPAAALTTCEGDDVALKLEARQKPRAANIFDDVGMLIFETLKPLLQMQRFRAHGFEKLRL